ncbi:MAG TPA: DNA methyltransferase, partial [Cytophagales bacterium]|nr:DNA methyltransferase [Cytophagales bacterium]
QVKTGEDRDTMQASLLGIEKKPLPHLLCTTNLMLHGFDVPAVRRDNYLNRPYTDWTGKDKVAVVLSNPPFGGVEEDGTETNFPQKFRTKETADLFLALIIRLLQEEGRAAVVLPDGTLFGEGVKTRLKEELLTKCNLHTIVRLPKGVFNPYTSINTNLLFFTKGQATKEIWYFAHPYPEGVKSYNKTKPIHISEFDLEKAWWTDRDNPKYAPYAWKVSAEEIAQRNYNLDVKNPHQEADSLPPPAELLTKHEATTAEIGQIQQRLLDVLTQALK